MELWDAYDKDLNIIEGITLVRGEEHKMKEGVFHLVCEILVRHADGTYLLMQRDPDKAYGSMWEASAGGSALKGESPLQGAIRELREETGIKAEKITELGYVVRPESHSIYADFLVETDIDKDSIVLQEGETVAYRWVDSETLKNMDKKELLTYRIQKFIPELH